MKSRRALVVWALVLGGISVPLWLPGACSGHGQKWVRLPFKACDPKSLPAAKTPDGSPLTLAAVAGEYRFSAGKTCTILIAPDGKVRCFWASSRWSASSRAIARIVDGRVELEAINRLGFRNGETCVCTPVWWQDKVYLLGCPESRWEGGGVVEFCNAINWGEEPAHEFRWNDLLYMRGPAGPATGTRIGVPESIANMILRAPLNGRIISVSPDLRANLGRRDGLYLGMRLFAPREDGYARWLRVSGIEEETCTLRPYHDESDQPVPRVGTSIQCDAKGADIVNGK